MAAGWLLFAAVIVVAAVVRTAGPRRARLDSREKIRALVRQAARWSTASAQDDAAMIAVLHANYGAGYLWALKDIASDAEIRAASGIDVERFTREIVQAQDNATRRMASLCPEYAPPATYLTQVGGEG
jgi:hypothetical protein